MKYNIDHIVLKTICVMYIFMVAMVGLLLMLDLILLPILAKVLLDPIEQDWCGIFSRCVSQIQQSFFGYLWSGAPWRKLNIVAIESRAKLAAIFGLFIGGAIMVSSFFARHR
jgi:hypothetical protein